MEQEAAQELDGRERHLLAGVVVSVIDVHEAHLAVADEGEPAIRNGDAKGVAAETLQHLPTLPEAQQQRCIPEDNLLCPKSRRDPQPSGLNVCAGAPAGGQSGE